MATEVYTSQIITLQDGEEVELRPLVVSKLRKFMRVWADHLDTMTQKVNEQADESDENYVPFTNLDLQDAQLVAFIKMCSFGLEDQLKGERTERQFLDYLENTLDEPTIMKILEVTGNFKTDGTNGEAPNPTAPEAEQLGTN